MEWTKEQRALPPLDEQCFAELEQMRGMVSAGMEKTRSILACRERQLTAALDENERLRQPVVTATGIIMSFLAYCAGNDRVPEHLIGAAKEWLKTNDPSFGNPAKGLAVGGAGWISVDQELPPEDKDVWAYQEDGVQLRALINAGEWFEHNCAGEFQGVNSDVTHWQPLPRSPALHIQQITLTRAIAEGRDMQWVRDEIERLSAPPSGEQAAEKRCTCKTDCHFNCGGYNCDCVLHA